MKVLDFTKESLEDAKKTGVYGIVHSAHPDIYYVGSAASTKKFGGFRHRWSKHLNALKHNSHHSTYLQNVVNKYGFDGLEFFIITTCDSSIVLGVEQYWINILNSKYNTCKVAGNSLGYKHDKNDLVNLVEVSQYTLEGKYVATYESITEASRIINNKSVSDAIHGRYKVAGGFQWRKGHSKDDIPPYKNNLAKKINCFHLTGELYKTYESALEASKDLNLNRGSISHNLNGRLKRLTNFIFKEYEEGVTNISQYKKKHKYQLNLKLTYMNTGEIIIVNSIRDLSTLGINRGHVGKMLKKFNGVYIMVRKNIKIEYNEIN